jgi:hypothetical protein
LARARPGWAARPAQPRPHPPAPHPAHTETQICQLRQARKLGPARIAPQVGLAASTVHRVLCRHGLNRLAWLDLPTGRPIRRDERARPGELVGVDVKQLGRIPNRGWPPRPRA